MAKEITVQLGTKNEKLKFLQDCWVRGQLVRKGHLVTVPGDDAKELIGIGRARASQADDVHEPHEDDEPADGGNKKKAKRSEGNDAGAGE